MQRETGLELDGPGLDLGFVASSANSGQSHRAMVSLSVKLRYHKVVLLSLEVDLWNVVSPGFGTY